MRALVFSLAGLLALTACTPAVDEQMIDQMEAEVRNGLAAQGTVKEVELKRESDDRMTGHAVVEPSAAPGSDVRFECTAERQSESGTMFNWQCTPPGAVPPADAGAASEGADAESGEPTGASEETGDKEP